MEQLIDEVRAAGFDKDIDDRPQKIYGGISTQVFYVDYKT